MNDSGNYLHPSYCARCMGSGFVLDAHDGPDRDCPRCDGLGINPDDKFATDYFRRKAAGVSVSPEGTDAA